MTTDIHPVSVASADPVECEPAPLRRVRAAYDALAADIAAVAEAAPVADRHLVAAAESLLLAEARWLDGRRWSRWLERCSQEMLLWVPIGVERRHPATDQSLLLDDRRRIEERIWRLQDPNAWSLNPAPTITRAVTAIEAWPDPTDGGQLLVSSVITQQYVRSAQVWSAAGRQVHRLVSDGAGGWLLRHKILLLPALTAGSPELGWLL